MVILIRSSKINFINNLIDKLNTDEVSKLQYLKIKSIGKLI